MSREEHSIKARETRRIRRSLRGQQPQGLQLQEMQVPEAEDDSSTDSDEVGH